jgi:hypothetical protein
MMKKIIQLLSCVTLLALFTSCESTQQILKQIEPYATGAGGGLTTSEIASGLKQALEVGAQILLPPEAQKVEKSLRDLGMGSLVDKAILSVNRAAEDAAKSAAPIFIDAIKTMTIQDALGILKGGDFAATNFLKSKTTAALTSAFKPVIENSLSKVGATKYWGDVFNTYNKFATNKVNPDLSGFVTGKAIDGIFYQVSLEEQKIRKDPVARVTDLLKKVFGSKEAQSGK